MTVDGVESLHIGAPEVEALERDFAAHVADDPNARIRLGLLDDVGSLPDPSLGGLHRKAARAKALSNRFEALDVTSLLPEQRIDAELAQLHLGLEVHKATYLVDGSLEAERMPVAADEIGEPLMALLLNDPRPAGERLADATERLIQLPHYLEAMLDRLHEPVRWWTEAERERVVELPEVFAILDAWAISQKWADSNRLTTARAAAETAIDTYARKLGELATSERFHLQDADARRLVAMRGVEQNLEGLHELAVNYLEANTEQLRQLHGSLVHSYSLPPGTTHAELFAFIDEDSRTQRTQPLDHWAREVDLIEAFVTERQLFEIPTGSSVEVMATPKHMRAVVPLGFIVPPPPLLDGPPRSLIYLTMNDDGTSLHGDLFMTSLLMHETVPGHHLQLAAASNHPSAIRAHIEAIDQSEGWATMTEEYMVDAGYAGEREDEARFLALWSLRRIPARSAIDLFFMTGNREFLEIGAEVGRRRDDPFEAAGDLLGALTGWPAPQVHAELTWYSQDRGYPLSFLVGNTGIWSLKADLAEATGAAGTTLDRLFHKEFLDCGNMPMAYVRRRVLDRAGAHTQRS